MNRGVRVLLGVLVLFAGTTNVWAQATAQINGTVADSSGGVLPGVTVVAIQTETGFRREAVTDETGSYALLNLPIGPYRLEATLAGLPHLRADRHRAAGQQQPRHPRRAAAGQPRGNGVGRSVRASRRDAQPRHRGGHRQRGGRSAAARRPQSGDAGHDGGRRGGHGRAVEPQHDHEPRHLDHRRPAVRRGLPARRRDVTTTCWMASTCRCRFPTRCRSSAWRPARRTRRTAGRAAAR